MGLIMLCGLSAQAAPAAGEQTVPVLLTSDIHFEPFWDPGKARQLATEPVNHWAKILSSANSPDREQRFAAIEQQCKVRGQDTSYPLLRSSLAAMRSFSGGPRLIAVSGDLMSHAFTCKFHAVFPHAGQAEYAGFAEKTIEFVLLELRSTFPGTPVFAALGNNDSDCGDYKIDTHSLFLGALASTITADVEKRLRPTALSSFAAEGDYSAELPAPFHSTRLLVVDDLFESVKYQTCSGKPDPEAGRAQVAWLQGQLEAARRNREQIWVVSHIPPGIDPYGTARKAQDMCSGEAPVAFLSSDALAKTLSDFGDVIRLAIFAHTHMDELRLLRPQPQASGAAVAVKMVPSISPVDGNNPSFVVAQAEPASATLKDYKVIAASNKTGIGTHWSEEYDFDREYNAPVYAAASLTKLIDGFAADRSGAGVASQSYLRNYFVGGEARELQPFWPQYVCALDNTSAAAYRSCACAAGK